MDDRSLFLGWDCANKSLAWSYMRIDLRIISKLYAITREWNGVDGMNTKPTNHTTDIHAVNQYLDALLECLQGFITFISAGVVDVIGGSKIYEVSEIMRTKSLYLFLTRGSVSVDKIDPTTRTVIEHQNKVGKFTNVQSSTVSHQLAFYYAERNPHYIDPKLKCTITFSGPSLQGFIDAELTAKEGRVGKTGKPVRIDMSAVKYAARKKHAKAQMLTLLRVFNGEHILMGVSMSVWDDLADSIMSVFADIKHNKLWIG